MISIIRMLQGEQEYVTMYLLGIYDMMSLEILHEKIETFHQNIYQYTIYMDIYRFNGRHGFTVPVY